MNYYCLFHNSGFRTYRIRGGESSESLDQMVTLDNRYDYPFEAAEEMNKVGVGFAFKYISGDTITLVVSDIPSIKLDTNGCPISCAFQIVAEDKEKDDLCKIASKIKSDKEFNTFYANLFSLRGGLHIDSLKLKKYIDEACRWSDEVIDPDPFREEEPDVPPQDKNQEDVESKKKSLGRIPLVFYLIVLMGLGMIICSIIS